MNGNLPSSMDRLEPVSLYFHIPFCTKKCDYCHFFVLPNKAIYHEQLIRGFKQEWELWASALRYTQIESIYFGGGTPALFNPLYIEEILKWIRSDTAWNTNNPEITLEANPENVNTLLMGQFARAGINRVSIGVQTLEDPLLQSLGRTHHAQKAIDAVHVTYEAGLTNISIDLMYDLPGQTLDHWEKTLAQVAKLPISHLSLYNLTLEPHTLFFKKRDIIQKQQPDPLSSLKMYQSAQNALESMGLKQYEISAFAKPGFHSHHNSGYWLARSFIGFGPSAFSFWKGKRFRSIAHLNRYCKALDAGQLPHDFEEKLDPDAHLQELLALQLRILEGVNLHQFESQHGTLNAMTHQVLAHLHEQGLVHLANNQVKLTQKGILFYDSVAVEII
jgi:oxygen-independent coproporphyrinogen III oxidase